MRQQLGFVSCIHFISFSSHLHSQHSGARRAHEAAHGDVGVRHPGLVALEAVFVYSGLGQLPDLAGADLLVVPVLSVRHLTAAPSSSCSGVPVSPVPVNRGPCRSLPSSAPLHGAPHAPHYAKRVGAGFRCLSKATAEERRQASG